MTGDVPSAEMAQEVQDPTSNDDPSFDMEVDEGPLPAAAPQQGWFGFSLRELIMIGAWVIAFALSFVAGGGSVLDSSATVWTMNGAWALAIGVPTAAVFLIVLRRLSPEGIRRVGSLGIDQFASVAFSVALVSWVVLLWQQLDLVGATRRSPLVTWPLWLEILLMLVLVAVTVFAALIPGLREDFEERTETLAHRRANPVRPVFSRPRPVRARGSVSDPQNEDDVDPGLLHDNEVGAAGHLSATGVTGAVVQGETGYVPEHHRESFLASGETPVVAVVEAQPSPVAQETVPSDDALTGVMPTADALTETISDADRPALQDEEPPAPAEDAREEGEPATRADVRRAAVVAEPEPEQESDSFPDAARGPVDSQDSSAAPQDLSDTMTEVLGDLLDPSSVDEVATHAVDVVPQDGVQEPDAVSSVSTGEQLQPFWALAPDTRVVHDARGDSIFTIGPEAWILVLEDRGGAFVVRHDDGRVGYLHDTENMTRG
ncbi:CvpA family protein [Microbacterium sp. MYb64]|uniref:CvpA family protein n=1 Tax=Microbacterium sp. MYb64 TaxID=1848691 RepID=UPI000CFA82B6|nr:CvpA family protein [Microbacterium sp. MYb64]PRB07954.1 hypothetical protein CQ044_04530 [Microbacterium sp. MYb64]